jgi:DNA polymerase I-like protein with 3'-5' exonuclease and polymerase domains
MFQVKDEDGDYVEAGTNMQNLRKGAQRKMLIPDPGEDFCVVDQWAAEAYITALDANEKDMMEMLDAGEKIHDYVLAWVTEHFPEEVEKAGYDYKKAKQTVHSLNYGVHADKMSMESGLPVAICEAIYAWYHNRFPGIKFRQKRIESSLINTKQLRSFLGRYRMFIAPFNDKLVKKGYAWPSQSCIGETTNIAMFKIFHRGKHGNPWIFPALNTHDGMGLRCSANSREAVEQIVREAFHIPLKHGGLELVVPVEIAWGKNFNDLEPGKILK